MRIQAEGLDRSRGESEAGRLEVGEILSSRHRQIVAGREYEGRTYNPMCTGKVRVTGPAPGIENFAFVLAKCDRCEYQVKTPRQPLRSVAGGVSHGPAV